MNKRRGFTLVEMLVTITVLGIVTLIAIPVISVVSRQLNSRKLDSYKAIVESGAKIYTDSHDMDLFGYQKSGCVDIYYTTLVSDKVIEELDFSNQNIVVDKIFVRVIKKNDNYSYQTYFPKNSELAGIDFNFCNDSISDAGPLITFSHNGNSKFEKTSYVNVEIKDMLGISPNAKISYQWFYTNGTPIGTAVTKDFRNSIVQNLTLKVDTPSGLNGKIKLIVTPIDLRNEGGLVTTDSSESNPFKLDNIAPNVVVTLYQNSGSNKTGPALLNVTNSNAELGGWKKHGIYIDFSGTSDENGIAKEILQWNDSGNVNMNKSLSDDRKHEYTYVKNDTLTAAGARYQKNTFCDEAGNCRSVDVIVYISPTFVINYNANGGGGNVSSTTCYYGYDCYLAGNGFSRKGHSFTKWKINGSDYNQWANVKNLTTSGSLTAYAQWNVNSYTVYYHVNDGHGYNGTYTTRSVKYGSGINTNINPQGSINKYRQFNWWDNVPSSMPDHDITVYAHISDYMCQIVSGHEKYNHVNSFRSIISQTGYPYSHTHITKKENSSYYYIYTDQDMSYWRAMEVFNYLWNNTPQCYCTKFLVYGRVSCNNGETESRCRQWACGGGGPFCSKC